MKKLLVVVDLSNIYLLSRKMYGAKVNYKALLNAINKKGEVYRAIAYGSDMHGEAGGFRRSLVGLGFEVRYKPIKVFWNNGVESRKADWDVGICMDVVQEVDNADAVVFVTADGDFLPCLQYIRSKGIESYVYGFRLSNDLKTYADYWQELDESFLNKDKHDFNNQTSSPRRGKEVHNAS